MRLKRERPPCFIFLISVYFCFFNSIFFSCSLCFLVFLVLVLFFLFHSCFLLFDFLLVSCFLLVFALILLLALQHFQFLSLSFLVVFGRCSCLLLTCSCVSDLLLSSCLSLSRAVISSFDCAKNILPVASRERGLHTREAMGLE